MKYQIPDSLTHADVLAAMQPLYDLLGVSPLDVFLNGLTFTTSAQPDGLLDLHVCMAAREVGDEGERARTVTKADGLQSVPHPAAQLAWVMRIKVS